MGVGTSISGGSCPSVQRKTFRIRLSLLIQTTVFLTVAFLVIVTRFSFYHKNRTIAMIQPLASSDNATDPMALRCGQSSHTTLRYVSYNETDLEQIALHIPAIKSRWKYVKPAMTSAERFAVQRLLKDFIKVCDLFNFTDYFIFSGTLLGSYRHHGIQPWDDDIDILMRYTDQERILNAFNQYANESEDLIVMFMFSRMKLFYRTGSIEIGVYGHRWPFLDMSFYHENDTHIWELGWRKITKYHFVLKSLIFPLHRRPFEAVMINSPKDAYAVLKSLFRLPDCVSLTWFHKTERRPKYGVTTFDCKMVASIYPFVFRRPLGSCMEESLWINSSLIYTVLIEEPTYAVSKPYRLELYQE